MAQSATVIGMTQHLERKFAEIPLPVFCANTWCMDIAEPDSDICAMCDANEALDAMTASDEPSSDDALSDIGDLEWVSITGDSHVLWPPLLEAYDEEEDLEVILD